MAPPRKFDMNIGNAFGKPDMERLGLFVDMGYFTGDRYKPPKPPRDVGMQMMTEGLKTKCGTQHGYMDKGPFMRLFEGEALEGRGKLIQVPKFKPVSTRPFMPNNPTKKHSTPGDHHGTFGGKVEAFSWKNKDKQAKPETGPNFYTNPGKKGGPGYVKICLNPYPEHKASRYGEKAKYKIYGTDLGPPLCPVHYPESYFGPNPYEDYGKPGRVYGPPKKRREFPSLPPGYITPTGPAKKPGGCHAGTFDPFPNYKGDKYQIKRKKIQEKPFYVQSMALKSMNTTSIVNHNTNFRVNQDNYVHYEPFYTKYLI